ncbi:transposase [Legionella cincinnatiensis]|uniref:Transposase n=1 Tax=Legionella cincinnatiensis TaxID=28085 RepID=A0A378IIR4_9GAMM|nr:transposase [Legionella cincinnatiensis]KTC81853.1 transposase [Legionella cincinnatiensis]STX34632.1 transposase [Legionella cincinnatiensis]
MLRASLVHEGRSIPIYNEIHSQHDLAKEEIHTQFLIHLKEILPEGKKIIIITDAGFKTPWFTRVNQLGWYFLGRVSGTLNYRMNTDKKWSPIAKLHSDIARGETQYFGIGQLGQDSKTRTHVLFTGYWGEKKGTQKSQTQISRR